MARSNRTRPQSARAPSNQHQQVERQRRKLQRASAVLTCALHAVEHDVDIEVLGDVIYAARDLVDFAAAALEVPSTTARK